MSISISHAKGKGLHTQPGLSLRPWIELVLCICSMLLGCLLPACWERDYIYFLLAQDDISFNKDMKTIQHSSQLHLFRLEFLHTASHTNSQHATYHRPQVTDRIQSCTQVDVSKARILSTRSGLRAWKNIVARLL